VDRYDCSHGYQNLNFGDSQYRTINITLPKFNPLDCDLWFNVTKNLFSLKRVNDEKDKYQLVVAALDLTHMQKLRYVLANMHKNFLTAIVKRKCCESFRRPQIKTLNSCSVCS